MHKTVSVLLIFIGVLLGLFTAAVNLGFALGPPVVARLYSITGSYVVPFAACALLAVFAAAILLALEPAYWLKQQERRIGHRLADSA